MRRSLGAHGDEPKLLQLGQVMRDGRFLQVQLLRQLAHAPLPAGHEAQQPEPALVGQCFQELHEFVEVLGVHVFSFGDHLIR